MARTSRVFLVIAFVCVAWVLAFPALAQHASKYQRSRPVEVFIGGEKYSSFEEYKRQKMEAEKAAAEKEKAAQDQDAAGQPPSTPPPAGPTREQPSAGQQPPAGASQSKEENAYGPTYANEDIQAMVEELIDKDPETLRKVLKALTEKTSSQPEETATGYETE